MLVWDARAAPRERLCALTMGHARTLSGWDLAGPRCGGRAEPISLISLRLTIRLCLCGILAYQRFKAAEGRDPPAAHGAHTAHAQPGQRLGSLHAKESRSP